ncbi:MAG: YbaB/EbfC family nucleoid-associated protein [Proteobacteria bacterium]|jgi:nucleoid-associated protein EbfC|nr:YbaB/EbfC family nucleoid-associated protein [Pseudomonadota bacterium]
MDVGKIMKQAQKMQEQLERIQEELARKTVTASSGGGMVTVIANGKQEMLSIKIAPEAVDPQDIAMLEDLVTAAVNEALRSAHSLMQEEMGKITGGLRIPGITP